MKRNLLLAGAVLAAALGATAAQAAIAVGDTIDITYLYPDTSSVYQDNSTTFTGAGTTLPIIYTGTASFDADSITLTQNNNWAYNPASFNGVKLTDLTNPNAFNGWGVLPSTTMTGFSESSSGGSLYVNWQGVNTFTGATVVLGAAVPEPATWAIMLLGVAAIGAAMRSGRKSGLALNAA
jgi:hypothetical protein